MIQKINIENLKIILSRKNYTTIPTNEQINNTEPAIKIIREYDFSIFYNRPITRSEKIYFGQNSGYKRKFTTTANY